MSSVITTLTLGFSRNGDSVLFIGQVAAALAETEDETNFNKEESIFLSNVTKCSYF